MLFSHSEYNIVFYHNSYRDPTVEKQYDTKIAIIWLRNHNANTANIKPCSFHIQQSIILK